MSSPITVDLPHSLGQAEARQRIEKGMGRLGDQIPGGAKVQSAWSGDRLNLKVQGMGQEISAHVDVGEASVRLEVFLPPALSFFGKGIEALLRRQGTAMLEDKRG